MFEENSGKYTWFTNGTEGRSMQVCANQYEGAGARLAASVQYSQS